MRIGLVIERFRPLRGGADQWTLQFVRHLLAAGHEVHVVAQDFSPQTEGLAIVRHPLGLIRSPVRLAEAAERKLRGLALDVIHDMGVGWHCDIFEPHYGSRYGQWERKLQLLPFWLRPWKRAATRLLPRYRHLRHLMQRQFGDPQRMIIALSKMVARDFGRFHGVPGERIRLIYNGVDPERFSPAHRETYRDGVREGLGIARSDAAYLFVGHDFALKGLASAIRAVGRLASERQAVRLMVVGGRRSRRHVRLARSLRLEDRVNFVGLAEDPVPYYSAADALVLPTFSDSCSLAVLEAAASGLPSVTTQFNGAAELLTDGVDGYVLADPSDEGQLADRLRRLLNPALRRRMGEAARRTALQHTFQRNCHEVLAVYRELSRSRRRAA
jgi:UDP-glucose:(heptosyl)LPS alpha-1,3-glucosyltransferase